MMRHQFTLSFHGLLTAWDYLKAGLVSVLGLYSASNGWFFLLDLFYWIWLYLFDNVSIFKNKSIVQEKNSSCYDSTPHNCDIGKHYRIAQTTGPKVSWSNSKLAAVLPLGVTAYIYRMAWCFDHQILALHDKWWDMSVYSRRNGHDGKTNSFQWLQLSKWTKAIIRDVFCIKYFP